MFTFNKTYIMKKIIFCLFVSFFVGAKKVDAQLFPWYEVTASHNAYSAGLGFNPDPEFIRGFCFAFDGVSPILQGYTVQVFQGSFVIGSINQVTFNYVSIAYPIQVNSSYLLACYYSIVDKLSYISAGSDRNFWQGYAELLLQASYNPNILYMNPGDSF